MTLRVVPFGIVFLLSTLCAARPTCSPSETFDQPFKAGHDFPRILRDAQSGNRDAQFLVGMTYEIGCGIDQDYAQAARWYRKAADGGHPGAQNNLGGLYLQGLGVE
jgi:TPR repeat protein